MRLLDIIESFSMNLADWIGFWGVLQILLAYFLNISGRVGTKDLLFKALNFSGALMAFIASYVLRFWPFMILEAIWCIISFISLIPKFKKNEPIGETDLSELIANMEPQLNNGEYVFVSISDSFNINSRDTIASIKEEEGTTIILKKNSAERLGFSTDFVSSWITLNVHSSLEAVGLTSAFSTELTKSDISCNVVAGYHHDHIFVNYKDAKRALKILRKMASSQKKTF